MTEEHGTEEQRYRKFFVQNRRENAAIDASPQEFLKADAGTLHDSCAPGAPEFLIARGVRNQMRHEPLLHIGFALIRFV